MTVPGDEFRHHPNEDVEQYFRMSAQWGVPAIAWNIVRPAFLWKLEVIDSGNIIFNWRLFQFCITEFMNIEKKRKEELLTAGAEEGRTASELEKAIETPVKERMSILGRKLIFLFFFHSLNRRVPAVIPTLKFHLIQTK